MRLFLQRVKEIFFGIQSLVCKDGAFAFSEVVAEAGSGPAYLEKPPSASVVLMRLEDSERLRHP
jgi:hypothetical protein